LSSLAERQIDGITAYDTVVLSGNGLLSKLCICILYRPKFIYLSNFAITIGK